MDADVFSLVLDWMYGRVTEDLDLQQAAHLMRAGDRLSILGLRDASTLICNDWLEHFHNLQMLVLRTFRNSVMDSKCPLVIEIYSMPWQLERMTLLG